VVNSNISNILIFGVCFGSDVGLIFRAGKILGLIVGLIICLTLKKSLLPNGSKIKYEIFVKICLYLLMLIFTQWFVER